MAARVVKEYIAGQIAELCCAFFVGLTPTNQTATFANGETATYAGVLTDPSTISLLVTTAAGVQTTYTFAGSQIVKEATGLYHFELTTVMTTGAEIETWKYRWVGTGACAGIDEWTLVIKKSNQS